MFLTLCDAGGIEKVNHLRASLQNNIHILQDYDVSIGLISKLTKVLAFLESATHLTECVIVFTDAFDVLCLNYDKKQLLSDFKATGKEIIVGAEGCFAHHSPDVKPYFDEKYEGHSVKYLNSGFIIAYKSAYIKMLRHILHNYDLSKKNDQPLVSQFMKENEILKLVTMDIDYTSKFVFTYISDYRNISIDSVHSYFIHVPNQSHPTQQARWNTLLTQPKPVPLPPFTLYTILFTREGHDPKHNKYIDMFYIWITYIIRNAGLGPADSIVVLVDAPTLEFINQSITLDVLLEFIPFRFVFSEIPVPKNISEGICSRYTHAPFSEGPNVLFLDIDIVVVSSLSPLIASVLQSPHEFFVMPEGELTDSNYGALIPTKTIGPGLAASWYLYKTSAAKGIQELFERIVKGCLRSVATPYFCIDQPFYNYEVYESKSVKIGFINKTIVGVNIAYVKEGMLFLNFCGEPGNESLHFNKMLLMLCMSYVYCESTRLPPERVKALAAQEQTAETQ